ncbi:MAG: peptide chain release factor N(5)-glutamine methyltransferase [Betaproteobacteria bacterium]|nr:peptide chain release factor N(5)-glutamine methyltransferase [Betaproteobacteria bacterium]
MHGVAELLRASAIDASDARVLLRFVLGVNDAYLIAHARDDVGVQQAEQFRALAARRAAGEPIAYIVGEREFYGRGFVVSPAVLIPRPETELLVELALQRAPQRVLDLGTGSGCVAISIALESRAAQVVAVDRSPAALDVARSNAQRLAARHVEFVLGDWYAPVRDKLFDVIVANPPYVAAGDAHLTQGDLRFEPGVALVGGGDGLDDVRTIVSGARAHLAPGGWLLFEHGHDQAARCRALLALAGFNEVQSWCDLAGIERVSGGRGAVERCY